MDKEYLVNLPLEASFPDAAQKTKLCKSIGCFVEPGILVPSLDGSCFTVNPENSDGTPRKNLQAHIGSQLAGLKTAPEMSKSCKFSTDLVFARSTGFLINNDGIIATAGHCVFQKAKADGFEPKPGFLDWNFVFGLNQDQVGRAIPAGNVFGIERILFGQFEQYEDMAAKTNSGGVIDLDYADCPDWALVRLKALKPSVLPEPLTLAPPDQVTDNTVGVWLAGYPWGTALKLASPPGDAGLLRTIVPAEEKSMGGPLSKQLRESRKKGYMLENVIRHNIRSTGGNSGSPVFLKNNNVVGIHASSEDPGYLEGKLFQWDRKPGSLIQPYFTPTDEMRYFHNATRNGIWSSLINPSSHILLRTQLVDSNWPKPPAQQGTITIMVDIRGASTPSIFWTGPASQDTIQIHGKISGGILPCDITSMTVAYTAPPVNASANSASEKAASPSQSLTAATPTSPSSSDAAGANQRQPRRAKLVNDIPAPTTRLVSLQVACTLPQDINDVTNWTAIYDIGTRPMAPDLENSSSCFATCQLSSWLSKEWKAKWVVGPSAWDTSKFISASGLIGSRPMMASSSLGGSGSGSATTTTTTTTTTTGTATATVLDPSVNNNSDPKNTPAKKR